MKQSRPAELTGTRKAAILMVLLGDEVAGKLLRHFSREEMAAVAREVAELSEIGPDLSGKVLEDYLMDALRPKADRGGLEVAQRLLSSAEVPEDLQRELLGIRIDAAQRILGPVVNANPAALAAALENEHPQTAALVLLHLPPPKAAQVLQRLPEEARSRSILRMLSLRRVPGELLGEVASSLEDRIKTVSEDDEPEGATNMDRTAEILQNLRRSDARLLLEAVENEDAEQAAQLHERVYSFETLILADDRGIQELLRQVESKTLALALHEAETSLVDKFMENLSERAANMLREEIDLLGAVRPQEVETARREVLNEALKLEQDERLVFEEAPAGEP